MCAKEKIGIGAFRLLVFAISIIVTTIAICFWHFSGRFDSAINSALATHLQLEKMSRRFYIVSVFFLLMYLIYLDICSWLYSSNWNFNIYT